MVIQKCDFPDGSFALHKVAPATIKSGRCSAWFRADGTMRDAEHANGRYVTRSVRKGGPTWTALQEIGARYARPQQ